MVDLSDMMTVRTYSDVIEAVRTTYDPKLGLSPQGIIEMRMRIKERAMQIGCYEDACTLIEQYSRTHQNCNYQQLILQECETDRRGNLLCTTRNFLTVMNYDPYYSSLRLNEMSMRYEREDKDGKVRQWTEADDAASRGYIESEYNIYSVKKHDDALTCLFNGRPYHPIKRVIEDLKWDGVDRIEHILTKWMKAEDSAYTREVSRLIFAGGINRLYKPGCKFEDMAVLLGKQGDGKSSFIRFLALEDKFFTELKTIEGKEALEVINGAWIVEVSELLALTKIKDQEAVKSFLSSQVDKYRAAYGRYTQEIPRTCAFIGTTNRYQFITDKTGGRRFYPVHCHSIGYDLFDEEQECREYIKQCWAEAYAKRDTKFMAPYASRSAKDIIEERQQSATEDDIRVGLIQAYLDKTNRDRVCTGLLWEEALGITNRPPERADQTQIGLIMQDVKGWSRCNYRVDFGRYGKQRHWKKERNVPTEDGPTYETPNDFTPY